MDLQECIDAFGDLVASGFPIDPAISPSRGYEAARDRFAACLGRFGSDHLRQFEIFESTISEIRRDDIIWNPLFGKLKLVMMNIPSIAHGSIFSQRAVRRWLDSCDRPSDDEQALDADARNALKQYPRAIEFLKIMAAIAEAAAVRDRE